MDIKIRPLKQPLHAPAPLPSEIRLSASKSITIGREPSCDLTLRCAKKIISRQHIRISKHSNHYELTDLSANGAFVNGATKPVGLGNSTPIGHQDIVDLGEYQLQFYFISKNETASNKSHYQVNKAFKKKKEAKPAPKLETKPNKASSSIHKVPIASTKESFIPPSVVIPEDWDTLLESKRIKTETDIPNTLQKPIHLSNDNELLKQLLKGMGLSDKDSNIEFTNENMLALGRCLRASISGIIKQCEHSKSIKSRLCFDDKNMLDDFDYSSFANFSSAEQFLNKLLNSNNKMHLYFPLEVSKCHKELMEDYSVTLKSYNKAIDSFREELSPFAVEQEFKNTSKKSIGITEKLVPTIGKWELYKRLWSDKCLNFRKIIKNNFEKNIKELHEKRINQRKITTK